MSYFGEIQIFHLNKRRTMYQNTPLQVKVLHWELRKFYPQNILQESKEELIIQIGLIFKCYIIIDTV